MKAKLAMITVFTFPLTIFVPPPLSSQATRRSCNLTKKCKCKRRNLVESMLNATCLRFFLTLQSKHKFFVAKFMETALRQKEQTTSANQIERRGKKVKPKLSLKQVEQSI